MNDKLEVPELVRRFKNALRSPEDSISLKKVAEIWGMSEDTARERIKTISIIDPIRNPDGSVRFGLKEAPLRGPL